MYEPMSNNNNNNNNNTNNNDINIKKGDQTNSSDDIEDFKMDDNTENPSERQLDFHTDENENNNVIVKTKPTVLDNEKCDTCGQFLNNSDIIYYQGHPQNSVEEYVALTNEKLVLASG